MQGNPRSTAIRAVAKEYNIDLELIHTEPAKGLSNDYLRINHLGQVPSFVGQDGYELTESIAIAIYGISSQQPLWPTLDTLSHRMRNIINYSYPCLKTTVEIHSHSEPLLLNHKAAVIPGLRIAC